MTTIDNLAETLHYMLDMDTDAAEDTLRTYITQIEELEDRSIDEDEINEEDADFLIGAVKSARNAGDLGNKDRAAIAAGASKASVARAAGISAQAVGKMVK